jgi:hypothetical protein
MSNESGDRQPAGGYQAFRQRLDVVLRQRDPDALLAFLVAEGQWEADAQTDVDMAMWMMIATSKALAHLHDEARAWLLAHGHAAEVNAIFGERPRPNTPTRRGPPPTVNRRADAPHGGQRGYHGRGSGRPGQHGNDRRPRG